MKISVSLISAAFFFKLMSCHASGFDNTRMDDIDSHGLLQSQSRSSNTEDESPFYEGPAQGQEFAHILSLSLENTGFNPKEVFEHQRQFLEENKYDVIPNYMVLTPIIRKFISQRGGIKLVGTFLPEGAIVTLNDYRKQMLEEKDLERQKESKRAQGILFNPQDTLLPKRIGNQDPVQWEEKVWEEFIDYFNNRKKAIDEKGKYPRKKQLNRVDRDRNIDRDREVKDTKDSGQTNDQLSAKKITEKEIYKKFSQLVAPHYKTIFMGKRYIYYSPVTLSLYGEIDEDTGETNLDYMLNFDAPKAPIGPDGKVMNLHHIAQKEPGPLVLITETFHRQFQAAIHFKSKAHYSSKPVDRSKFTEFKKYFYPLFATFLHRDYEFSPDFKSYDKVQKEIMGNRYEAFIGMTNVASQAQGIKEKEKRLCFLYNYLEYYKNQEQ